MATSSLTSPRTHDLINIPGESVIPTKIGSTRNEKLAKVWNVVKWILIAIANVALFFINSTLWTIGFVAGVVWDKKAQEMIDKVFRVWKEKTLMMAAITGVAGFLAIQVTLAATSVAFGAHLGSTISRLAKERASKQKPAEAALE